MQSFKSQVSQLWSVKSAIEEIMFDLQDLGHESADEAARLLDDAFEIIEEAIGVLAS